MAACTHLCRHLARPPTARQWQLGRAAHVDEHLVPRLADSLHHKAGLGRDQLDSTQVGRQRAAAAAARAHALQQLLQAGGAANYTRA